MLKLSVALAIALCAVPFQVVALPPPEDLPEEVLRTEIITEARSPLDGQPVTATEYAEIQETQRQRTFSPDVNADTQQIIFLLRVRKLIQLLNPF